jgi:hypothetical protein
MLICRSTRFNCNFILAQSCFEYFVCTHMVMCISCLCIFHVLMQTCLLLSLGRLDTLVLFSVFIKMISTYLALTGYLDVSGST